MDVLATFAAKQHITYTLLSDEGSTVIRALGLFNEHVFEHHAAYGVPQRDHHWGVPYPGVFLLDEQGYVRHKRFQQSYRERETGVALLEQGFGLPSTYTAPQYPPRPRASRSPPASTRPRTGLSSACG